MMYLKHFSKLPFNTFLNYLLIYLTLKLTKSNTMLYWEEKNIQKENSAETENVGGIVRIPLLEELVYVYTYINKI